MRFHRRLGRLAALSVSTVCTAAALAAPPADALPTDPAVRTGKLSNGMGWMYRQHNNPPGKMALLLNIDTGSLNETDAQRGLAHFIEHMCFNGSEHYPPGTLVPYFESIGMEFGADLNASTGFDATRYMLFLPDAKAEEVDRALVVLSDFAFRTSFVAEEIEKERGIILSEKRARENVASRLQEREWAQVFGDARFVSRLPIGTEEIIKTAPRQAFVDYYKSWYRPDKMTLIMVGDAAPEPFLPLVEKYFGSAKNEGARPESLRGGAKELKGQRAFVLSDPEYKYCSISISRVLPARPPTTTRAQYRTELVESLAQRIINKRFGDLVRSGDAAYQTAGVSVADFFRDAYLASASSTCEPTKWEKSLEQVVEGLLRVREFGVEDSEYQLAVDDMLADFERSTQTESTTNARAFLMRMAGSASSGEPVMSAKQLEDIARELVKEIKPSEVLERARMLFAADDVTLTLKIDPSAKNVPTDDALLAALRAALARKPSAPTKARTAAAFVTAELKPAEVAERNFDEKLGITHAWLSNGVRFHHRFMDYKKDDVLISINFAGGTIEESGETLGTTEVAGLALSQPATRRHTSTEIADRMTGKNIRVTGAGGSDKLSVRILGSPANLELAFELAHALISEGKIEQSAFDTWKAGRLQQMQLMQSFPEFHIGRAIARLTTGNDPRFDIADTVRIEKASIERGQAWFERMCASSPIEMTVVGEIPVERALELAQRYIGSLPDRPRSNPALAALRKLKRAAGPLRERLTVAMAQKKAVATAGFMTAPGDASDEHLALNLAANVMTTRVIKNLREEKAWVYSISASADRRYDFEDFSKFACSSPCAPERAEDVVKELEKMFAEFAAKGPSDEELAVAKKQLLNRIDTTYKEPRFWWTLLEDSTRYGVDLKRYENPQALIDAVTRDQVQSTFAKYCKPERMYDAIVMPEGALEEAAAAKSEPAASPSSQPAKAAIPG
ncbi:MAG: insulinase family protein [Phycisphaerae bacterium]|nr:insulinase family protein [Phycisphaerae bacterium]